MFMFLKTNPYLTVIVVSPGRFAFFKFSFHFNKSVILTLINAGLFQTFDVVEIHMTSQYSKNHLDCLTNQNKGYAITLINI